MREEIHTRYPAYIDILDAFVYNIKLSIILAISLILIILVIAYFVNIN